MDRDAIMELRRRAQRERDAAASAASHSLEETYLALAESYDRLADAHERLLTLRGGD